MARKKVDNKKKKIIDVLNIDRADELAAILQYMGHNYEGDGFESPAIVAVFKATAMDEMRHAGMLAERIVALGGVPVQKASAVKRGGTLKQMVKDDLDAEDGAVDRYKRHIRLCNEFEDSTTRRMLEEILADEERHEETFRTILGIK